MVTGTMKIGSLIHWAPTYHIETEDGNWFIYYYTDEKTMYKIQLNTASKTTLKTKREQLLAFLNQDVTLSGTVIESFKKELVTNNTQTEAWVKQ